jgi:GNAT superfamily N-acetyltransferase
MTKVHIRPAVPAEAATLSDLALRSKGHWGYDQAFLDACRDELTIAPEWCDGIHTAVATCGESLLGFYRLSGEPPEGTLESLFVEPSAIGSGVGRQLFDAAVARARELRMTSLRIESDPFAAPFYRHLGAEVIGETPSGSIAGRSLPLLRLAITPSSAAEPSDSDPDDR